jgi:protein-S-isoprenylcysteine O-methyltransferase Ste14
MMQWILFTVASLLVTSISWKSLHNPRSHGFYRFFAWEAILGLIVINVPIWFQNPFSWNQIISWALLAVSLIPLTWGVNSLRSVGRPDPKVRSDPGLLGIERTTNLVKIGIYKYIRHPLYSSLFLLNWGTFFKRPGLSTLLLSIAAAIFLIATAKADERECMEVFGSDYQEYMKHTYMFIPYLV